MTDTQQATMPVPGAQIDAEPQTVPGQGIDPGESENGSQDETKLPPPREGRYRTERNEARAERDAALALVETLQTREVERLASELAQPADLLALSGVTLAELIGEDGYVNAEAVAEAVAELIESRPGLAKNPRQPATDSTQGRGNGIGKGSPTWGDLLKN